MPTYEYKCETCGNIYEEIRKMSEKGPEKCLCGEIYPCFHQVFDGYNVIVNDGVPKTIGQLAEYNSKKLPKTETQKESESTKIDSNTKKLMKSSNEQIQKYIETGII